MGTKILSSIQTKEADQYTILHEPISSIRLMERASRTFVNWFVGKFDNKERWWKVAVICGTGNNGGDGLAIARILPVGFEVSVWVLGNIGNQSADFKQNLQNLIDLQADMEEEAIPIEYWTGGDLPDLEKFDIVIDGILGSGLSRPLDGECLRWARHINAQSKHTVSIDIPTGMVADGSTVGETVFANNVFSFHAPKLAFMSPESAKHMEKFEYGDIGLHPDFLAKVETPYYYFTKEDAIKLQKPRPKFSHKGTYGHALLVAGSTGKMGACILAAEACLKSGVGLCTLAVPSDWMSIVQVSTPRAMAIDQDSMEGLEKYQAIGIGPGLGTSEESFKVLSYVLKNYKKPIVLDADALNLLSQYQELWDLVPALSILTPHPKEFERLFGSAIVDFAIKMAQEKNVVIVLKGAHTATTLPDGVCYFNSTGSTALATGGSGDTLTGIITSLLAQGYSPAEAARLGCFIAGTTTGN